MPAYCCICRRTPADYDSLYRFPQNLDRLAVWKEKFSTVKKLIQTDDMLLSRRAYVLFLETGKYAIIFMEIPSRSDQNYEKNHISSLSI